MGRRTDSLDAIVVRTAERRGTGAIQLDIENSEAGIIKAARS